MQQVVALIGEGVSPWQYTRDFSNPLLSVVGHVEGEIEVLYGVAADAISEEPPTKILSNGLHPIAQAPFTQIRHTSGSPNLVCRIIGR